MTASIKSITPCVQSIAADGTLKLGALSIDTATGQVVETPKDAPVTQLPPGLIALPGFVDAHCHLPQYAVTGHWTPNLLAWLDLTIFPTEARFHDDTLARQASKAFFQELARYGITSAGVFTAPMASATDIAFQEAEQAGLRVVMGQTLMDRDAPEAMLTPTLTLLQQTEALYHRWQGKANGRLRYAWLPRFPLNCSPNLLEGIGQLMRRYPQARLHTHLAEQPEEVEAVLKAFPQAGSYTEVYEQFGLIGPQSLFAHGVHLSSAEHALLHQRGASLVHCPSANCFLKSGVFPWQRVKSAGLNVAMGSDVGAGTTLNPFSVMRDAHFIQQSDLIHPLSFWHAATQGGAKALGLDTLTGKLVQGYSADFILVDTQAPAPVKLESTLLDRPEPETPEHWQQALSRLVFLAPESVVIATFVQGQCVYQAPSSLKQQSKWAESVGLQI